MQVRKGKYIFWDFLLLAFVGSLMIVFSWVGHVGSDDQSYIAAAQGWIDSFPYVGQDHWALRHAIVIPMAAIFKVAGISELTSIFPVLIYYFFLVLTIYIFLSDSVSRKAGICGALLISTSPLISVHSTIAGCDVAEIFLVFSSVALFYTGTKKESNWLLFFFSGLFMAFAWFARVTGVGLGIFFFVLFVINYGRNRKIYFYMFYGLMTMLMVEFLFYWIFADNPLHRIETLRRTHIGAASIINPQTGNIIAEASGGGMALKSLFVLLFNQEFSLLFWFSIPAVLSCFFLKTDPFGKKRIMVYFSLLFVIWYIFLTYLAPVRLLPRYYGVIVMASCVILSVYFDILTEKKVFTAIMIVILIIFSNILGIAVENKNPLFDANTLVRVVDNYQQTIYTDPFTANKASFKLKRLNKKIFIESPHVLKSGSIYFFNPNRINSTVMSQELAKKYTPPSNFEKIESIYEKERLIGRFLDLFPVRELIPDWVLIKLKMPNEPVHIYRVP